MEQVQAKILSHDDSVGTALQVVEDDMGGMSVSNYNYSKKTIAG